MLYGKVTKSESNKTVNLTLCSLTTLATKDAFLIRAKTCSRCAQSASTKKSNRSMTGAFRLRGPTFMIFKLLPNKEKSSGREFIDSSSKRGKGSGSPSPINRLKCLPQSRTFLFLLRIFLLATPVSLSNVSLISCIIRSAKISALA